MYVKNRKTGAYRKVKVSSLEEGDDEKIVGDDQFEFDWRIEKKKNNDLYKLYLLDEKDQILGLLSLRDIKSELRIHINLIEVSSNNIGQKKEYDRIAGCLIAYACQLSFDKSYDGFVSLVPKSKLVDHYCKHYGFQRFGRQLGLGYKAAVNLIKEYL